MSFGTTTNGWRAMLRFAWAFAAIFAAQVGDAADKGDVADQFFRYTETENKVQFQEHPGETVDPFTGNLTIVQQDLTLPGKAGLDLKVVRTYSSKVWGRADLLVPEDALLAEKARSVLGYGWSFHMGRLSNPDGTGDAGTCNSDLPVFEGGDGSSHSFYKAHWSSAVLVSKDYWRYERNCAAMGGGGACVWSDTGIRYEFSSSADDRFYVGARVVFPLTGIVDQFGNRISVSYVKVGNPGDAYRGTGAVEAITDTWLRRVDFTYVTSIQGNAVEDGRRLATMTVSDGRGGASKQYTYSYEWVSAASVASGDGRYKFPGTGRFFLKAVQPPAGPPQSYEYGWNDAVANNQYALKKLTYPGGGNTEYTYSPVDFFTGREMVPFSVITQRKVSTPRADGGATANVSTWGYAYVSPSPMAVPPTDPAAFPFHVATITRPDGKQDVQTLYGFGWIATKSIATNGQYSYAFLVGLPRKISRANGAEVEEFGWDARTGKPVTTAAAYSAPAYSDNCGAYLVWDSVVLAPALTRRVLTRDGAAYLTDSSNFDDYGQPQTVVETGYQAASLAYSDGRPPVTLASGGTQSRTITWTYAHYLAEKTTGRTLNLVRGLPLTQRICVGNDCVENAWSYEETSASVGYPRKTETHAGVTTTFQHYDNDTEGKGNLWSVTNALNQKVTMAGYAAGWGIPTTIDFNGAFSVTREAFWEGWLKSSTDGRQNKTEYTYDPIGRRKSLTPPGDNAPTTYDYAADNSFMNTLRGTFLATTYFDGMGRPTTTADSEGVYTSTRYDAMEREWFKSYPFDAATAVAGEKRFFDGLGRVEALQRAFLPSPSPFNPQDGECETPGACTVWSMYAKNCVEETVERNSTETPRTMRCGSSFGSPDEQRLAAVVDPQGSVWQYTYGAADDLLTVQAPLAQGNRSYSYLPVTRFLQEETTRESGTTVFTRNAVGQPMTRTDARSVIATFGYKDPGGADDKLGRLRTITYGAGSDDDVTQTWDSANNLETISSPNGGAYTFIYDEVNRVTGQIWQFGGQTYTTSYHYDANGCLDEITQPTGTVLKMTCDTLNRPTSVKASGVNVVDLIAYHPSGQVKRLEYSNGVDTDIAHDGRGRTSTITSTSPTETVMALGYTYDGADNVKTFVNGAIAGSALTFEYDLLDRLETAYGPLKGTAGYGYDELGNRKLKSEGNSDHLSNYSYDPLTNRLSTATTQSPIPALTLTWDLAGRLAATSDGTTYKYDARGKRVSKTDASGTIVYHHDFAGRVIAETTLAGAKLRDFVYVGNQLAVVDGCQTGVTPCSATREWYHTDTLGSVLARTNSAGAVVARLDYQPWGEQFAPPSASLQGDRQYNGRVYDASTGFHDYGARMYWPEIGRFVSADSVMGEPGAPGTLNRYSYVLNNPYKYVDPTGRNAIAVRLIPYVDRAIIWCESGGCQAAANAALGAATAVAVWAGIDIAVHSDGTLLPDEAWDRKAPHPQNNPDNPQERARYGPPGERMPWERFNPETGELEISEVEYDTFGRQKVRTDYTDHGQPDDHTNPHHHDTDYGPGKETGKTEQKPGPAPGHPDAPPTRPK